MMNNIHQLQSIYPSLILSKENDSVHWEDYEWFQTHDKEKIGIKKTELRDRDTQLLSLFLEPLSLVNEDGNDHDQAWYHFLKRTQNHLDTKTPLHYRFVYFSVADLPTDRSSFQEAFQSLFPERMPLFFESPDKGFIIEEYYSEQPEILSFEEIIDVLMSDFYTKIRFFISEFSSDIESAPAIFEWSEHSFKVAEQYRIAAVATYKDILPYLFIDALPLDQRKHITRSVLHEVKGEPDLLHTIQVFLESGSNATLAAKNLYMHRNSLQYRVDKFTEKTGLDVKQFQHGVSTYLALLLINN